MNRDQNRPAFTAGIAQVDIDAPDLGAEIETRLDAALQQALDRARDRTSRPDFEIDSIHLGDVFEVNGEHYVKAVVFLMVENGGKESGK